MLRLTPGESIRNFTYDHRTLSLKWKPDMGEEVVQRILSSIIPKLASCLHGSLTTVADSVKRGTMGERDWAAQKDYWAKVNSQYSAETSLKKTWNQ